jgi:ubiquinol-cytochrome c reductase cytochrome b subunit
MVAAILILAFLPFYSTSSIRSNVFRPFFKVVYWFFISIFFVLGWIGGNPVETECILKIK